MLVNRSQKTDPIDPNLDGGSSQVEIGGRFQGSAFKVLGSVDQVSGVRGFDNDD